jgi:hypothetical protein
MSNEQNAAPAPAGGEAAASAPTSGEATAPTQAKETAVLQGRAGETVHEPIADDEPFAEDEWAREPDELPPRPRRHLLAPVPVTLLSVLLLACGFIGGVLVEKGQNTSTTGSATAGLASRLAALRGGVGGATAAGTTGAGASGGAAAAGGGGFAGRFGGLAGASARGATIGEVSYIDGHTLYVSTSEGNTVKVNTSAASAITKTVPTDVHGIHPGETVIVRGAKGSGGAISAESISVSTGLTSGGGLGALFGGAGESSGAGAGSAGGAGATGRGTSGGAAGGGPALFGN